MYVNLYSVGEAINGLWLYRVDTCTDTSINYAELCYSWVDGITTQDRNTLSTYDSVLTRCPCNFGQAKSDPQFYQEIGSNCFYTQYSPSTAAGARVS